MVSQPGVVRPSQPDLQDLERFINGFDDRERILGVTDHHASLAQFLMACAAIHAPDPQSDADRYPDTIHQACDVFIQSGLLALAKQQSEASTTWVQIGIHPQGDEPARRELFRQLAELTRHLLDDASVSTCFFMQKDPGLRLRFQAAAAATAGVVEELIYAQAARWQRDGLIDHIVPGVYEPENQIFGGPQSMAFVHALFTIDSQLWLDYYASVGGDTQMSSAPWLVSLAVLRTVFAGLGIDGWEDIGVWERIRNQTGRRLGPGGVALPDFANVANEIRNLWSQQDTIVDVLDPEIRAIVTRQDRALLTAAQQWRTGYFEQRTASVGPRAAAAYYVIFHWNRAGLSPVEQALLVESLADRVA